MMRAQDWRLIHGINRKYFIQDSSAQGNPEADSTIEAGFKIKMFPEYSSKTHKKGKRETIS